MNRPLELILSAMVLILGSVPLVCIASTIRLLDGAPVFFVQTRIGRHMRPFRLYKFRTMKTSSENNNSLTIGMDPRITRLGGWLRKYHLDELPQLFNILIGDMSFIGPRPEIPEFVNPNDPLQQRVLLVRPGLFDSATLLWLDESQILVQADDWKEYYRKIILPDKLRRSLKDIKTSSGKHDIRLLKEALNLVFLRARANKQTGGLKWKK